MSTTLPHCSDAFALAEAIAHLCEDAHPFHDGWRARCPHHQGTSDNSLSIDPADDRVILHCFGGCEHTAVVHALGLRMADLFVEQRPSNGHKRIVAVYDYVDADGTLVHQTVRYEPKAFRQRRPDPVNPGEYLWNLTGIEPVLYHLPQVLAALQRDELLYLVEGEKDVHALERLGLTATCNPMGAGKWRRSYSATLRGAHVVILPDNDQAGVTHTDRVARALDGIAASVKVVPGLHAGKPGGDISDWCAAGGTREALEAASAKVPFFRPFSGAGSEKEVPIKSDSYELIPLIPLFPQDNWPSMGEEAYYGLAGDYITTLEPYTESDPVALLLQFLTYFSVLVGRSPFYEVEATRHYANLHITLVGRTAKARKGTSYDHVDRAMRAADTSWTLDHCLSGCGSGEALVYAVRDRIVKREPIKTKGRITGYQEIEVDPGVVDKRLLVSESEFSTVLKVCAREGSLLSENIRKAWETGHLRNMVKTSPIKATNAHVGIIGHITKDELLALMQTTDMTNGFGNRLLWACVQRSCAVIMSNVLLVTRIGFGGYPRGQPPYLTPKG